MKEIQSGKIESRGQEEKWMRSKSWEKNGRGLLGAQVRPGTELSTWAQGSRGKSLGGKKTGERAQQTLLMSRGLWDLPPTAYRAVSTAPRATRA